MQEDPDDIEMLMCLGLDYHANKKYAESKEALLRFLRHPKAVEKESRCQAMCVIAKCAELDGHIDEACRWLFRAIAEDNKHRDVYVELALTAYRLMDWHMVLFGACKALEITDISSGLGNEIAYGHVPYHLASLASSALGMFEMALNYAKQALELSPDDAQLRQNIKNIEILMS